MSERYMTLEEAKRFMETLSLTPVEAAGRIDDIGIILPEGEKGKQSVVADIRLDDGATITLRVDGTLFGTGAVLSLLNDIVNPEGEAMDWPKDLKGRRVRVLYDKDDVRKKDAGHQKIVIASEDGGRAFERGLIDMRAHGMVEEWTNKKFGLGVLAAVSRYLNEELRNADGSMKIMDLLEKTGVIDKQEADETTSEDTSDR